MKLRLFKVTYEAWEIKSIMGYKIQVGEKAERNTTKTRKKEGRL